MPMIRTAVLVALVAIAAARDALAGTPLETCYEAVGAQARTAVGPCLERLLEEAEAAMDRAFAARKAKAVELAEVTGRDRSVKSLDRSQQRFLAYRKAQCQYAMDAVDAGSGAGDVQRDCMVRLTRQRAELLGGSR